MKGIFYMNILSKMEQKEKEFEQINESIKQKENEINQLIQDRTEIQGAYKLLLELGFEEGIIDKDGKIINEKEV